MLTKDQMMSEYTVLGYALGMCVVERKERSNGKVGTIRV